MWTWESWANSDPVPYEDDNITHYELGSDPEEKYLPSKLENPEKRSSNIPFSPVVKLPRTLESQYFVRNAEGPDLCRVNGN